MEIRNVHRTMVLLLSGLSGMGGLVYEVIYLRQLTSVLGDMFYVHAALVSMFLLGNGVGAKLAKRFVTRLAAFEIIVGLWAIAMPAVLGWYQHSALIHWMTDPGVNTLVSALLLLAVPSTAIGFSIPLFAEYVRQLGRVEQAFNATYMLYNVGAALSLIIVEFWLVRTIGFTASLGIIGTVNIFCGLYLLLSGLTRSVVPDLLSDTERIAPRLAISFFLASLSASVFQWLFIKICYHLFLPHRENFAICTAIIVFSIALGTLLVGRFRLSFDRCLALAAVSLVAIYAGYPWIDEAYYRVYLAYPLILTKVITGFVLAIPYVFLGATIPSLVVSSTNIVRRSGDLLFLSGIANVVGLLLFTFILFPRLELFTIVPICAGLILASLALQPLVPVRGLRLAVALLAFIGAAFVSAHPEELVFIPKKIRQQAVTSRGFDEPTVARHYKHATDSVSHYAYGTFEVISYNGHPSIEVSSSGIPRFAESVSGLIPALLAPSREDALVLGLGTGTTGGAAATMFDNVDIVEINAAFFPLAAELRNFSVFENPAAHIIHDDARRYLSRMEDKRYDAIINSIPSPTYYSAGKIYTVEFYAMVRRALKPGGVYSSWFTSGDMSQEGLFSFFATLAKQFEYCNFAILRDGYYFTTCSDRPVGSRPKASESISPELQNVIAASLQLPLDEYVQGVFLMENILERLDLRGVPINSDDFPVMEFQILSNDPPAAGRAKKDFYRMIKRRMGDEREDLFLARASVLYALKSHLISAYAVKLRSDRELSAKFKRRIGRGQSAESGASPRQ